MNDYWLRAEGCGLGQRPDGVESVATTDTLLSQTQAGTEDLYAPICVRNVQSLWKIKAANRSYLAGRSSAPHCLRVFLISDV